MSLPRELRHNMTAIYCENRNGATLQTLPRALGDSCGHGPSISDAVVRAGRSIAWPFREMFPLLPGNISGRELAILCLLTQGFSTEIDTIEMRLSGCFQLPLF